MSRANDQFDLVVRGPDGILKHRYFSAVSSWTDWTVVDARPVDSSAALATDDPTRLTLFARAGGELLMKTWNQYPGGTWGAWTSLGKIAVSPPVDPGPLPPADADGDGVIDASDRCAVAARAGARGRGARRGCSRTRRSATARRAAGSACVAYYVKATTGARVVVTCSRGCKRTVVKGRGSKPVRIRRSEPADVEERHEDQVTVSLPGRLTTTVVDRVSRGRRVEGRARCVPVGC